MLPLKNPEKPIRSSGLICQTIFGTTARLTWSLPPHSPWPGFSGGLTSKLRHDHRRLSAAAYVGPFARSWPGLSTTDPRDVDALMDPMRPTAAGHRHQLSAVYRIGADTVKSFLGRHSALLFLLRLRAHHADRLHETAGFPIGAPSSQPVERGIAKTAEYVILQTLST
jgi:hypothetical protein